MQGGAVTGSAPLTAGQDAVPAEAGCRLWTAMAGQGAPLVLCHGGPGLWDMFGALATPLAEHLRVIR